MFSVVSDPVVGRKVVATTDISAGTTIVVASPLYHLLQFSDLELYCCGCTIPMPQENPVGWHECQRCRSCTFCKDCHHADPGLALQSHVESGECDFFIHLKLAGDKSPFLSQFGSHIETIRTVLRSNWSIRNGYASFEKDVAHLQQMNESTGLTQDMKLELQDGTALLVKWINDVKEGRWNEWNPELDAVRQSKRKSDTTSSDSDDDNDDNDDRSEPSVEETQRIQSLKEAYAMLKPTAVDLVMSESQIQDLLLAVPFNQHGIVNSDNHLIGTGLFPSACMFNHSCRPNVLWHLRPTPGEFPPVQVHYVAVADVKAEESLNIVYLDVFESYASRQAMFESTYHTQCKCERCCLKGTDIVDEMLVNPLCTACGTLMRKLSIEEDVLKCAKCGRDVPMSNVRLDEVQEYFRRVYRTMYDLIKQSKHAEAAEVMRKQLKTEEHVVHRANYAILHFLLECEVIFRSTHAFKDAMWCANEALSRFEELQKAGGVWDFAITTRLRIKALQTQVAYLSIYGPNHMSKDDRTGMIADAVLACRDALSEIRKSWGDGSEWERKVVKIQKWVDSFQQHYQSSTGK
eukprot:ANDGO_05152.mRNA.1 hypothetical protein